MDITVAARGVESIRHRVSMLAVDAQNVTSSQKEHLSHWIFLDFAARLGKLAVLLKSLQQELEVQTVEYVEVDMREMEAEVTAAEELINNYRDRCSLYLLLSCQRLLKRSHLSSQNLSKALKLLVPFTCSMSFRSQLSQTQLLLEQNSPSLNIKQQTIIELLGMDTLDSLVSDPALGNEIALQIAEFLGVSLASEDFKKELSKLKTEEELTESHRFRPRGIYLEQCIQIFERAVAASHSPPTVGRHMGYMTAPNTPGRQMTATIGPLQPLLSFICPITKEVMKDPVQIASGITYERSAIQKWFQAGQTPRCPMGVDLKNTKMKSNIALRQSIAEWRERNYTSRLDIAERLLLASQTADASEQLKVLTDLQALCEEDTLNKYAIATRGLIGPLVHVLESKNIELRMKTCSTLRSLALDNVDNQDLMVAAGVIDLVVRCLSRHYDEAQQAVLLLQLLSEKTIIAERISHAQGAVLLLVTLLGCEQNELVCIVKAVLRNVPTNDENIVIMAKANMLTPLVQRLVTGSLESKIVMAKTIAELHMPDTSKLEAGNRDSIATLTNMMNSARDEERDAAISALKNLSTAASVCQLLADCSGLEVLVRMLTSIRSSTKAKVEAATVIANLLGALGDDWPESEDRNTDIESYTNTFLSFMNPSNSYEVQGHLLQGLLGLAKGTATGVVAKEKMKGANAFGTLIPLLKGNLPREVRYLAVQLFSCLSRGSGAQAWDALKQRQPEGLRLLVEMIQKPDSVEREAIPAMAILARLPRDVAQITSTLVLANLVPVLSKHLATKDAVIEEAAVGALRRFTSTTNPELQLKLAQLGVIPKLVSILDTGRPLAKVNAANALANFSMSTPSLVGPVVSPKWFACFSPTADCCKLHGGTCTVETTFCLLEADAITPLLAVLKEGEPKPAEAALVALSTLVDDSSPNSTWDRGCDIIARADGIPLVLKALSKGRPKAQEVAVNMCEKFFRLDKYRDQYGASAQMHIITVAQKGSPNVRHVAGRVLRQLDLLHSQSLYFGQSNTT